MEATVDLYAKLVRSSDGVTRSEKEIAKATEIVAKSFKAGGAAAGEQAAGILQLGQALGSGLLQGDELRSIRENAPLLAKAIADEFGVSIGKLKELGAQGVITSNRVFKAILKSGTDIEAAFKQTTSTIEDSFTRLQNSLGKAAGTFDQWSGSSKKTIEVLEDISTAIDKFVANPNLETFSKIVFPETERKALLGLRDVAKDATIGAISKQMNEADLIRTAARQRAKIEELNEAWTEYLEIRKSANDPARAGLVELETADALAKVNELRAELDELDAHAKGIEVTLDISQAKAAIDELRRTDLAALWADADKLPEVSMPKVTRYSPTTTDEKDKAIKDAIEKETEATNRVAARATDVYRGVQQTTGAVQSGFAGLSGGFRNIGDALRSLPQNMRTQAAASGAVQEAGSGFRYSGNNSSGSWAGRQMTFGGGSGTGSSREGTGLFRSGPYMPTGGVQDASSITSGATSSGAINVNVVVKPILEGTRLSGQSTAEIKQAASAGANSALRQFYGR